MDKAFPDVAEATRLGFLSQSMIFSQPKPSVFMPNQTKCQSICLAERYVADICSDDWVETSPSCLIVTGAVCLLTCH